MVYPEPCKELRRRPQLFMVGVVPYLPSSTQVLIVAHIDTAFITIRVGRTLEKTGRDPRSQYYTPHQARTALLVACTSIFYLIDG